jgi:phosphate transport system ATP-binding protein
LILATKPDVLLLDEPISSLDSLSTKSIEELMLKLKEKYTIIFVTHNILLARKVADQLVFVCNGELVEYGKCSTLFNNPKNVQTKAYLTDEFCNC